MIFRTGTPGIVQIEPRAFGSKTGGMQGNIYIILNPKRDSGTEAIPGPGG